MYKLHVSEIAVKINIITPFIFNLVPGKLALKGTRKDHDQNALT